MDAFRLHYRRGVLLAAFLVACLVTVGCQERAAPPPPAKQPPAQANPAAPDVPPQFAAARQTFDTNCAKCHPMGGGAQAAGGSLPGQGGPPGGFKGMKKAPDLAHVGGDPKHTREWLVDYIRDPKSQNPNARMPKFAGKLADADLDALADYLVTLK